MKKAVILLSGGLDSCVSASIAVQKYGCYALTYDYGQTHREIEAAENLINGLKKVNII